MIRIPIPLNQKEMKSTIFWKKIKIKEFLKIRIRK